MDSYYKLTQTKEISNYYMDERISSIKKHNNMSEDILTLCITYLGIYRLNCFCEHQIRLV